MTDTTTAPRDARVPVIPTHCPECGAPVAAVQTDVMPADTHSATRRTSEHVPADVRTTAHPCGHELTRATRPAVPADRTDPDRTDPGNREPGTGNRDHGESDMSDTGDEPESGTGHGSGSDHQGRTGEDRTAPHRTVPTATPATRRAPRGPRATATTTEPTDAPAGAAPARDHTRRLHPIRFPEWLWDEMVAKAAAEKRSVAAAVNEAAERWIREG